MSCKQCAGDRQDKHGRCFYCGAGEKREFMPGSIHPYQTQQQLNIIQFNQQLESQRRQAYIYAQQQNAYYNQMGLQNSALMQNAWSQR